MDTLAVFMMTRQYGKSMVQLIAALFTEGYHKPKTECRCINMYGNCCGNPPFSEYMQTNYVNKEHSFQLLIRCLEEL